MTKNDDNYENLSGQSVEPDENSTRVENLPFPVDELPAVCHGDPLSPGDENLDFFDRMIARLRVSSSAFSSAKSFADLQSRSFLADIAEFVESDEFDIHIFGERFGKKITKANKRNRYLFVMRCLDDGADRQVQSNSSLALKFAVEQCVSADGKLDTVLLRKFLAENGIKKCLRGYRETKKADQKITPKPKNSRIVHGIPPQLSGKVLVELNCGPENVQFVRLVCESAPDEMIE